MADQKHVDRLGRGVDSWNDWIRHQRMSHTHSGTRHSGAKIGVGSFWADLSGADLRGLDLYQGKPGAGHTGIDLIGANLANARLQGCKLAWANLTGATLSEADLSNASLANATILGASLVRTNLSIANLAGADLLHANLFGAKMSKCNFYNTNFADTNLNQTDGLESCQYSGPCSVDHRTMFDYDLLPTAFLRGCGVPEGIIEYLPSMRNESVQLFSCFISYSTKDQIFADRLHADLQNKGVRCWFAPHDLKFGAKTWDAIDEAIRLRDKVLLILSQSAIDSGWVEDEVNRAYAEERERQKTVLFPIRIDEAVMKTTEPWARKLRDQRNIGDFRRWVEPEEYLVVLGRVLRDLRAD